MVGNLQPLDEKFAIVGPDGRPTLYFIKWAQQRQLDIVEGLTLEGLEEYLAAHPLQEGSGIQFNPDGNLANSPIIAADVQEILDQLTSTRGAVIYRGLGGWAALLPGTAGQFLQTAGTGADPLWAAGGGGGGGSVPTLASTGYATWINQGTATVADTAFGISFTQGNDGAHRLRGRTKVAPATPYRARASFDWGYAGGTASGIIFGWYDPATTKAHTMLVQFSAGIFRGDWTNPNTGAAFTSIGTSTSFEDFTLELRDDGTNIYMNISYDKINFRQLYTVAKAAGFLGATGYTNLIVGVDNFNGDGAYIIPYYQEL